MLIVFTLAVMAVVAYIHAREGLFTAVLMLVNVVLAGLLTFNFWEPLANFLTTLFGGPRGFLAGYEDMLAMVLLFGIFLAVLRLMTEKLNDTRLEFPPAVQAAGGGLVGALTGYLISGLLIVAFETLPWGQHFLGFEPRTPNESAFRSVMPPDRVWLALMHRAGTHSFNRVEIESPSSEHPADNFLTFDRYGTFELFFFRLRRLPDR